MSLLSHDAARAAAAAILDHPGADEVEVVITASSTALTRFARSEIIQNTDREEVRAYVRLSVDGRVASASTSQLDPASLSKTADDALHAARASLPDPEWPGLADPAIVGRPTAIMRWDEGTAARTAAQRSEAVIEILDAARCDNTAGVYGTGSHAFGVFSSKGVDCYDAYTRCATTCLVDDGDATGWGEASSFAASSVDHVASAKRARCKADAGRDAALAEPGIYEVILEPPATATLIEYLAYVGFSAKQVLEGDSFLATRAGERVASESATVADDAFHPLSVGLGFDLEGVPRQRVAVIDGGRATGPVTDLRTAALMGGRSTGHYSGSGETGPYASNVVLEEGTDTPDELIAGVKDGILVTRFHYVNVLDGPSTLLTGMTRDGTFLIKDGEIAGGVRNFRFAQNVLDALASATGIGNDATGFGPEYGSFGSTVAPTMRLGAFNFASRTSH